MAPDTAHYHQGGLSIGDDDVAGQAAMYRVLIENAVDIIIRTDASRRRTFVSPSTRQVLGYEPCELLGGTLYQTVHPDDLPRVQLQFSRIGPEHPNEELTFRLRRKDGRYVWIEARYRYLPADGGILGILRDITVRKQIEAQLVEANVQLEVANRTLRDLADHDGLTGLCNRRHFDELLNREFGRARRQQLPLALALLDIDFFKAFNDRYGHLAGDSCLRQVCGASTLGLRRPADLVARFGGEEIVVLLPGTDERGGLFVAERIRGAVASLGIEHHGSPFGIVTISAGVTSLLPGPADDPHHALVEAADQALYRAKSAGRNQVCRHNKL